MKALALVALLLGATTCTESRDVLSSAITDCNAALAATAGEPCNFTDTCSHTDDVTCTSTAAACEDHVLELVPTSNACVTCTNDSACTAGAAICGSTNKCEACPSLDVCPIVTCPANTAHLTRNGCPVCECAPVSACAGSSDAACPSTSAAGDRCYRGGECAAGCLPSDVGCCTNECAAPGCEAAQGGVGSGIAPTGCAIACGATTTSCVGGCIADHCDCVGSAWECTAACANGLTPTCTFTAVSPA